VIFRESPAKIKTVMVKVGIVTRSFERMDVKYAINLV
jgi:hypothetical protein